MLGSISVRIYALYWVNHRNTMKTSRLNLNDETCIATLNSSPKKS